MLKRAMGNKSTRSKKGKIYVGRQYMGKCKVHAIRREHNSRKGRNFPKINFKIGSRMASSCGLISVIRVYFYFFPKNFSISRGNSLKGVFRGTRPILHFLQTFEKRHVTCHTTIYRYNMQIPNSRKSHLSIK